VSVSAGEEHSEGSSLALCCPVRWTPLTSFDRSMPNLRKSPLVSTRCHTTALSHGTTLHHVVGDASAGRPDDATLAEMPWNSRTFAAADCTRADELKRLGHQLAEVVRPDGNETMAFVDVWMAQVVPRDMDDHVATARSTSIRYMVRPRCVCGVFSSMEW
jgi:hypothetical protein